MPVNVSDAIDADTAEIITVTRTANSGYVDGIFVKGTTVNFKALASVQAPTGDELQDLPEGSRDSSALKFFSKRPIFTISDRDDFDADIITYQGIRYKIVTSRNWNAYGHTVAIGVRDQNNTG